MGTTPLTALELEPGTHQLQISLAGYLDYHCTITVEGRAVTQHFELALEPAWAMVSLTTEPPAAAVLVDGEPHGTTPLTLPILQGPRDLGLQLNGYKHWQRTLNLVAGEDLELPLVHLELADGLLSIRSSPAAAGIVVRQNVLAPCTSQSLHEAAGSSEGAAGAGGTGSGNLSPGGGFLGLTPLQIALPPGQQHEIRLYKTGYQSTCQPVRTAANKARDLTITLEPILASVVINATPADAELFINGQARGPANQTLELMATTQQIEIRKPGYVPYHTEFTARPGLAQELRVTLKSDEQARQEQVKPEITTTAGQTLKLFYPTPFTMGASRREAGRRPNEVLREGVRLTRPFYLGLHEVSNAEYRQFDPNHNSGTEGGVTLNNETQPVVRISWLQAARYCNWLSRQEALEPFYLITGDQLTGINPDSTGYRLPTEAEWAWVARTDGSGQSLKYPWGDQLPPPANAGNFADATVQNYQAEVLVDYNDGHFATAPVASFTPNYHGVYDMAGNVAEWIHDFYGSVGTLGAYGARETDPLGPEDGEFHLIRGSSWMHGATTELRLSFRDFGLDPRPDTGFRLARYLAE